MSKHIRARDGFLCTACRPRTVGAALVHHVKPLSHGGAALDPENLTSLCKSCHIEAHGEVVNEEKQTWVIYLRDLRNTI